MLLLGAGCKTRAEWDRFFHRPASQQPEAEPRTASSSLAMRGTIAPLVTIQSLQYQQVRGFGLVVDLVDTGGRDGPEVVRKYLLKEIRRREQDVSPTHSPLEILNSRDSTMVELTGFIPAGAEKGDRFDVSIRALGTEATSLVGGRLVLGELKVYAATPSGVLGGKTLAVAEGPVFVSPFDRLGRPTDKVDLRRGVALGGGTVQQPRLLRLVLNEASPSRAQRIERRLNSRYAGEEPVAIGRSTGVLELKIPREFRGHKRTFLERALRTTLNGDPPFLKRRSQELIREFKKPEADGNAIGLALEAIGAIVLPDMQPLYADKSVAVSYYASRTGVRLGDREAGRVLARLAEDAASPFRKQAIDELGWAVKMYAAGETLRKLLSDPNDDIRIAAYKALRRRPHPAIETKVLDEDNLFLDTVDSRGSYLIYIQRRSAPRIAVFGRHMACTPPVMFPGDRDDGRRLVTQLSARSGDEALTFKFKNKHNGGVSPKLLAPLEIVPLIEYLGDTPTTLDDDRRVGFAVPYSEIVDILSTFCHTKCLSAKLVIQSLENRPTSGAANEREESEF